MFGHNKDEKNGAGGFVAESVVASEDDVVINLTPEGKAADKKKVAMIVAGILVVIGVGVGVWWWINNRQVVVEGEVLVARNPDEMSDEDKSVIDERKTIVEEVNSVAYEGEVYIYSNGGNVYDYGLIEKNLNEYLNSLEDESGRVARTCFSAETLSIIGDIDGATALLSNIDEENLSRSEKYHCYIALASYSRERGDAESASKYWDLLKETDIYKVESTRRN